MTRNDEKTTLSIIRTSKFCQFMYKHNKKNLIKKFHLRVLTTRNPLFVKQTRHLCQTTRRQYFFDDELFFSPRRPKIALPPPFSPKPNLLYTFFYMRVKRQLFIYKCVLFFFREKYAVF